MQWWTNGARSLEGTVLRALKKGNRNTKSLTQSQWHVPFLNMVLHAGIHAEKGRYMR